MAKPAVGTTDPKTYIEMYTTLHDASYNGEVPGVTFYGLLATYLTKHLEGVAANAKEQSNETLLAFYLKEWQRYTAAAKYISHLFRYVDRHYALLPDNDKVHSVYNLHLVTWRDVVLPATQERVTVSALQLVEKKRKGEVVDLAPAKDIVDLLGEQAL
jgi:cullin 1